MPFADFFWKGISPEQKALTKKVGTGISGSWGWRTGAAAKPFSADAMSFLRKIRTPSIKTTAKIGAVGAVGYTAYKGSESIGRFFETGAFTKKEAVMAGEGTILPAGFGAGEQPTINILPQKESFWGELGAGAGGGLQGLGTGAGSGLGMALPIVAIGAIILLAMKEKKK